MFEIEHLRRRVGISTDVGGGHGILSAMPNWVIIIDWEGVMNLFPFFLTCFYSEVLTGLIL